MQSLPYEHIPYFMMLRLVLFVLKSQINSVRIVKKEFFGRKKGGEDFF